MVYEFQFTHLLLLLGIQLIQTGVRAIVVENFFMKSLKLSGARPGTMACSRMLFWLIVMGSIGLIMFWAYFDITCAHRVFSKYLYEVN